MTQECPECGEECLDSVLLTEQSHNHRTNIIRKNSEANAYCVEYITNISTNGVSVKTKLYLHKKDFTEDTQQ